MRKIAAILLLSLMASGCNPLSALGFLKPSSGIDTDVEIVAGDKEIATDVSGEKTVNTAENISYNIHEENKGPSVLWVGFAFLGWILPSPRQIWLAATRYFRRGKT